MDRVVGKVVFITGAASGVGRETARKVVENGGKAVVADVNEEAGRAVAEELGAAAHFVKLDVSDDANWQTALAAAVDHFGRIDGLVNNAGICRTESIEDTTLELFRKTMQINAEGTFLGCKYGIAHMKQTGGGAIVNLSSTAALVGHSGMAAYTASKGAVTALTRNVATNCRQKGYRIRCNSVHPAGIRTPMTVDIFGDIDPTLTNLDDNPQSSICEPGDVASVILFLLSDESRFINGAELRVDNAFLISIA
ncbi:SDR family oxidoreductase [Paraburkholderia sacchari]|uniref:SDR family oxidoreductase n=1 Tax=Paraburkholderia sacchari TaxID=159450 RepID=UPI000543E877|nr:SDR family oxidoreductase [Paraburkholderia sacchari]NLP64874.1 SDR family oxidoreductase [Paraburkholderia sacchari]